MIEIIHKAKTAGEKQSLYEALIAVMEKCQRCKLCNSRHSVVPGEGPMDASVMFVGEGPGADEDTQGRPFVGKAGQLLTKILTAARIPRKEVYITNIVKCRPPENRVPQIEETLSCQIYLEAQIALIAPKVIVSLGNTPTQWFLNCTGGITRMRGRWFSWHGTELMPMFHPSYLLRNESREKGGPKDLTWQDIQQVKAKFDLYKHN